MTVRIGDVEVGGGVPKVIVPITPANGEELLRQIRPAVEARPDLIEWRIDHLDDVSEESVTGLGATLRSELDGIPVLVTFRTSDEGGEREIPADDYAALYGAVIAAGVADAVDVETARDAAAVARIVAAAHAAGVAVIGSFHDFGGTPPVEGIVGRLVGQAELGVDICKVAVMPESAEDVLALMSATAQASARLEQPLITMSMGGKGVVSRLAGEIVGSSATFGMVGNPSAPGQVAVDELRRALALIDSSL